VGREPTGLRLEKQFERNDSRERPGRRADYPKVCSVFVYLQAHGWLSVEAVVDVLEKAIKELELNDDGFGAVIGVPFGLPMVV
jgi:hypothetical protein